MLRLVLTVLACLVLCGTLASSAGEGEMFGPHSDAIELTSDTFREDILESDEPALVLWTKDEGCPRCVSLAGAVDEAATELHKIVRVFYVVVGQSTLQSATDMGVKGVPWIQYFPATMRVRDGRPVKRPINYEGLATPSSITRFVVSRIPEDHITLLSRPVDVVSFLANRTEHRLPRIIYVPAQEDLTRVSKVGAGDEVKDTAAGLTGGSSYDALYDVTIDDVALPEDGGEAGVPLLKRLPSWFKAVTLRYRFRASFSVIPAKDIKRVFAQRSGVHPDELPSFLQGAEALSLFQPGRLVAVVHSGLVNEAWRPLTKQEASIALGPAAMQLRSILLSYEVYPGAVDSPEGLEAFLDAVGLDGPEARQLRVEMLVGKPLESLAKPMAHNSAAPQAEILLSHKEWRRRCLRMKGGVCVVLFADPNDDNFDAQHAAFSDTTDRTSTTLTTTLRPVVVNGVANQRMLKVFTAGAKLVLPTTVILYPARQKYVVVRSDGSSWEEWNEAVLPLFTAINEWKGMPGEVPQLAE